jgi:hypothetical protein
MFRFVTNFLDVLRGFWANPILNPAEVAPDYAVVHVERRGGPTPINQEKQAACKAARNEWLSAHDAIAAGSTKRGDVYLCHGERN